MNALLHLLTWSGICALGLAAAGLITTSLPI